MNHQHPSIGLVIDCATTPTKEAVHNTIAEQLSFPSYYGANLDALVDCLTDTLIENKVVLTWKDTPASLRDRDIQAIHHTIAETLTHHTAHHHKVSQERRGDI